MSAWRFGDGSFIVSDEPTGYDDPDNVRAYGGHLVCESVSIVHGNLLLAAPDLLEALERLLSDHEAMLGDGVCMDPPAQVTAARAAIAKAKGGAQ